MSMGIKVELSKDFTRSLHQLAHEGEKELAEEIRQFALNSIPVHSKNDCDDGYLKTVNGESKFFLARRVITRQQRLQLRANPKPDDPAAAYNYVIGYCEVDKSKRLVCVLLHNRELAQWIVSGLCGKNH
ncbi:hypothetical protein ACIBW9_01025 [Streptomyces sp. NPDC049541]|uniref:hypothetical protein n=1 Tax=Streptomyces sp. NPDC049541 TaxID=3365594 RepID=UPI0037BA535A